jgi:hypothetical protein
MPTARRTQLSDTRVASCCKFIDALTLLYHVANIGDARSPAPPGDDDASAAVAGGARLLVSLQFDFGILAVGRHRISPGCISRVS